MQFSLAAFTVLNTNCAPAIQLALRRFLETAEPGYLAMQYLDSTYQAKDSTNRALLLGELANTEMRPGEKVGAYLNRAMSTWEQLREVGAPLPETTFITFLLKGLPPDWGHVKRMLRQVPGHLQTLDSVTQALQSEQRDRDLELHQQTTLAATHQGAPDHPA